VLIDLDDFISYTLKVMKVIITTLLLLLIAFSAYSQSHPSAWSIEKEYLLEHPLAEYLADFACKYKNSVFITDHINDKVFRYSLKGIFKRKKAMVLQAFTCDSIIDSLQCVTFPATAIRFLPRSFVCSSISWNPICFYNKRGELVNQLKLGGYGMDTTFDEVNKLFYYAPYKTQNLMATERYLVVPVGVFSELQNWDSGADSNITTSEIKKRLYIDSLSLLQNAPHMPLFAFYTDYPHPREKEDLLHYVHHQCNNPLSYQRLIGKKGDFFNVYSDSTGYMLYHMTDHAEGVLDTVNRRIYAAMEFSPRIVVYDLAGNKVDSFGKYPGNAGFDTTLAYLTPLHIASLMKISSRKQFEHKRTYLRFRLICRSNYFQPPIYNHGTGLIYRTYRTKLTVQTTDSLEQEELKDRQRYGLMVESFNKLSQQRLQIYNPLTKALIFDEAVPAPFHILEVKGDTLWAVAGMSEKGLKIVKYVMRKE